MGTPRGGGRGNEAVVVDALFRAEFSGPHGQLHRSPTAALGVEILLGGGAREGLLLAGEDDRARNLPGAESDVPAHGSLLQALLGEGVLREQAERPHVVVASRSQARAVPAFGHSRSERKETALAKGLVRRQRLGVDATGGGADA